MALLVFTFRLLQIRLISVYVSTAYDVSVLDLMPHHMELLCPGKDVCRTVATANPSSNITSIYEQCCRDCSCSADCGLEEPCCFPWMSPNTEGKHNGKVCTRNSIRGDNQISHTAFYMVVASRTSENAVSSLSTTNPVHPRKCGDIAVAEWGSLFPESSVSTKHIYKNRHCAKEHGVNDSITWTPFLVCSISGMGTSPTTRTSFSEMFSFSGLFPANCFLEFYPPVEILDQVQRDECFTKIINVCDGSAVYVPNGVNLTSDDVKSVCESGFYSPFVRDLEIYSSVFCFMCNSQRLRVNKMICKAIYSSAVQTNAGVNVYTMLLDPGFFLQTEEGHKQTRIVRPELCDSLNKSICKQRLCPTGQNFNQFGSCQLTSSELNGVQLWTSVFLTPKRPINTSILTSTGQYNTITWLRSPWSKDWSIKAVLLRDIDLIEPGTTRPHGQLIVFMALGNLSKIEPKRLIYQLTNVVSKQFQICFEENCISADQKYSTYEEVGESGEVSLAPLWANDYPLDEIKQLVPLTDIDNLNFSRVYLDETFAQRRLNNMVYIGKLAICQQIELKAEEFTLHAGQRILYYKSQGLVVFENEFDLQRNSDGSFNARICVDGTRFTEQKSGYGQSLVFSKACWFNISLLVLLQPFRLSI